MAVQFDAASDRVSRASAPDPVAGITFTCWFRIDTDRDDFSTLMRLHAGGGGSTTLTIGTGAGGVVMQVFSAGGSVASAPAVVGDWYRVAYTITGTSVVLYLADEDGATSVFSGTVTPGATPDGLTIAGRSVGDADEPFTGTLAYPRLWTGTVSNQTEVEAEWASAIPVRTSGLWADWPVDEDLLDASGNARHLSAGTTAVTFVEGPPLAVDVTGTATGQGGGTGTATGIREAAGQATGAGGGTGAATGVREVVATAVGAGGGAGATAGVREVVGAATGTGGGVGHILVRSDAVTPPERTHIVPADPRGFAVPAEFRTVEV